MPREKHIKPAYQTRITGSLVSFWYDSKTHKYYIVKDANEEPLLISKAKAKAVIGFLKWISE